jgi:ribosomal protein S18 acetylase RimI-like enzyme
MLHEAVFWRAGDAGPSLEEGLAYPEVKRALAAWGRRDGDTAVVATVNAVPVGASWYRYWTDDNFINGYVEEDTPVLVIAVENRYRHQGIGGAMICWLMDRAAQGAIQRISLSVSKDNYAINLYRQQGFVEYADNGDAFTMVRELGTEEDP